LKSRVALAKGGGRAENIESALKLIESDIDLHTKSKIFIKVNFVSTRNQLAATHVDSVRALLRFLRKRYDGKITVGESTDVPAFEGYRNFGYLNLVKEFDIQLVDINEGDWVLVEVYDSSLRPMKVRYSKQVAESDFRISIGPPKTHDVVIITLSIKNLAMGALYYRVKVGTAGTLRGLLKKCYLVLPSAIRRSTRMKSFRDDAAIVVGGDKRKIHQGYPVHNLDLYLLARAYPPHLSVIDGYIGMEGNGPIVGDPVPWGIAVASQDPVAADCLAAQLMGFSISDIGYLWYCSQKGLGTGDIGQMEILGANLHDCYHRFSPPANFEAQKCWPDEKVSELLSLIPLS
jgi:uncharacterized protein (DUF362 family)